MRLARMRAAILLSLMLLLGTAEAAAQRTGRIQRIAEAGNVEDAELAMGIMARCVASRRETLVRTWFAMLPGTREEAALIRGEVHDLSLCLEDDRLVMAGRAIRFPPGSLRRPVALALVERRISQAPEEAPLGPDAEPWFVAPLGALARGRPVDRGALVIQDFGHCVVLGAWRESRALFATRSGSDEESAVVDRLMPKLGPCLAEGVTVNVTRRNLRLMLAEPFYHLMARAPR
jgi:hypothetical protein